MSDTNEIRLNRGDRLGHKLLDATSESKSIVSVSTFSNNLRSLLQQLFTDNNNQRSEYNKRVLFLFYGLSRYRGKNHMDQKDDDEICLLVIECSCSCFTIIFSRHFPKFWPMGFKNEKIRGKKCFYRTDCGAVDLINIY